MQKKPNSHVIAVLMRGRIAQILADADTHQDAKARERLVDSANRIGDIVNGKLTPELAAQIERIEAAVRAYEALPVETPLDAGTAADASAMAA